MNPRSPLWPILTACLALPVSALAQDGDKAEATEEAEDSGAEPEAEVSDPLLIPVGSTSESEEIEALRNRIRALEEQFDALQAEDVIDESDIPLDLETKVHGYADVSLRAFRLVEPITGPNDEVVSTSNHPPGFEIGDLVISYNANLDRRVYATVDLVYGLGHFGEQLALVDRIDFEFALSEAFSIRAGKFQSPFGYWNTNIPYGSYLYAPYQRPAMLQFERHGSFITTRQTGIDFFGEFNPGFWRVGYHVGIGNGRSAQLARTQDIGDGSAYKTTWAQVWIESPGGFQVGLTGQYDPLRQERLTLDFNQDLGDQSDRVNEEEDVRNPILSQNLDEYLIMPHLVWRRTRMELIAEAALLIHRDTLDRNGDPLAEPVLELNRAAYVQWSHRIQKSTPYVRADFVEWWRDDPVFLDLRKQKTRVQGTVGLRQEVALHAALKFEGTYIDEIIYKHPDDPTYLDPNNSTDQAELKENPFANQDDLDRFGLGLTLAVGF